MSTIVISQPDTTLSVDQSHFTLRCSGRKIGRIPPTIMDQVVIYHGVEVSRKALSRLGTTGVPVTFLDQEGRVEARLVPTWKYDATPRLGQARAYFDPVIRLRLARRLVDAKIANAVAVLRQHGNNYADAELLGAAARLLELRDGLPGAASQAEIMGLEGAAGRVYFGVFGRLLRPDWAAFNGRTRRPPLDPVNAVLSYGYAVLQHQLMAYLESQGLDPYIGCLHTNEPRRPTLALDLMEPFRPTLGDRLALRLINLGTLKPEHFGQHPPQPGTYINYEGRVALLKIFADWSSSCDETLGANMPSPGLLLLKESERYAALAAKHRLEDFIPYYASPALARELK